MVLDFKESLLKLKVFLYKQEKNEVIGMFATKTKVKVYARYATNGKIVVKTATNVKNATATNNATATVLGKVFDFKTTSQRNFRQIIITMMLLGTLDKGVSSC